MNFLKRLFHKKEKVDKIKILAMLLKKAREEPLQRLDDLEKEPLPEEEEISEEEELTEALTEAQIQDEDESIDS